MNYKRIVVIFFSALIVGPAQAGSSPEIVSTARHLYEASIILAPHMGAQPTDAQFSHLSGIDAVSAAQLGAFRYLLEFIASEPERMALSVAKERHARTVRTGRLLKDAGVPDWRDLSSLFSLKPLSFSETEAAQEHEIYQALASRLDEQGHWPGRQNLELLARHLAKVREIVAYDLHASRWLGGVLSLAKQRVVAQDLLPQAQSLARAMDGQALGKGQSPLPARAKVLAGSGQTEVYGDVDYNPGAYLRFDQVDWPTLLPAPLSLQQLATRNPSLDAVKPIEELRRRLVAAVELTEDLRIAVLEETAPFFTKRFARENESREERIRLSHMGALHAFVFLARSFTKQEDRDKAYRLLGYDANLEYAHWMSGSRVDAGGAIMERVSFLARREQEQDDGAASSRVRALWQNWSLLARLGADPIIAHFPGGFVEDFIDHAWREDIAGKNGALVALAKSGDTRYEAFSLLKLYRRWLKALGYSDPKGKRSVVAALLAAEVRIRAACRVVEQFFYHDVMDRLSKLFNEVVPGSVGKWMEPHEFEERENETLLIASNIALARSLPDDYRAIGAGLIADTLFWSKSYDVGKGIVALIDHQGRTFLMQTASQKLGTLIEMKQSHETASDVNVSQEGKTLARVAGRVVELYAIDPRSGMPSLEASFAMEGGINRISLYGRGSLVVREQPDRVSYYSRDKKGQWHAEKGLSQDDLQKRYRALVFSADRQTVAGINRANDKPSIFKWRAENDSFEMTGLIETYDGKAPSLLSISPTGGDVALARHRAGSVIIWTLNDDGSMNHWNNWRLMNSVQALEFDPDGQALRVRNARGGEIVMTRDERGGWQYRVSNDPHVSEVMLDSVRRSGGENVLTGFDDPDMAQKLARSGWTKKVGKTSTSYDLYSNESPARLLQVYWASNQVSGAATLRTLNYEQGIIENINANPKKGYLNTMEPLPEQLQK